MQAIARGLAGDDMKTVKITDEAYKALESAHKKTKVPKMWIVSKAVLKFLKSGKGG
jgi:hypothetical protein